MWIVISLRLFSGYLEKYPLVVMFHKVNMRLAYNFGIYVKPDNGLHRQEISLPNALQPYKGYFPHRLMIWPVGLGASMTP